MTVIPIDAKRIKTPHSQVARLRERHHRICRYLAWGLPPEQVAEQVGSTAESIRQLASSPANQELIAQYRQGGGPWTLKD